MAKDKLCSACGSTMRRARVRKADGTSSRIEEVYSCPRSSCPSRQFARGRSRSRTPEADDEREAPRASGPVRVVGLGRPRRPDVEK